jgi:hypothetical protein
LKFQEENGRVMLRGRAKRAGVGELKVLFLLSTEKESTKRNFAFLCSSNSLIKSLKMSKAI